ncbi:MAG: hypothetical protein AB1Z98_22650 [Nannocystaceae bacterium]
MKTQTTTPTLLTIVRDALAGLFGYPPVMQGMLTRRLEDRS